MAAPGTPSASGFAPGLRPVDVVLLRENAPVKTGLPVRGGGAGDTPNAT
jgi:hypothetical protein